MQKLAIELKDTKIPVIYEGSKALPVVNLKLIFKSSGALFEKKQGLAKICAGLLNEGTKKLGVNKFSKLLEDLAIDLEVECGFESFVFEIKCLKEHFAYACSMLKELLQDPNFTQESLNKIKMLALGEIASLASDFDYQASRNLSQILYPNSRLGGELIGTKDSIASINLDDILEFYSALDLQNLFIVLGGDVDFESIKFDEILSTIPSKNRREISLIQVNREKNIKLIKKQTNQAYIYFGAPYNVEKNERFKANLATFILGGGGFGSRIMEEIRVKRGLAYSAYVNAKFSLCANIISGYLQTKNQSKDEAIEVVNLEFLKFVENGVTQKELDGAKNFILGSEPLSKETLFKRLNIAQMEFYNGFELGEFDRNLARIKETSLEDLNKFIKEHNEILDLSYSVVYDEI